jgi:hypothetical protein
MYGLKRQGSRYKRHHTPQAHTCTLIHTHRFEAVHTGVTHTHTHTHKRVTHTHRAHTGHTEGERVTSLAEAHTCTSQALATHAHPPTPKHTPMHTHVELSVDSESKPHTQKLS